MVDATAVGYAVFGLLLCVIGGGLALSRNHTEKSFYAADVYHMSARSHRRFAGLSAVCGAGFVVSLRWAAIGIPLLAIYVLLLVLYASSFARGFSGEDE